MSSKSSEEFSRWRLYLWPIHRWEIKKFVPLLILYALICFNYSLLKAAKDALVITANSSGAAVIPFIKIWAILPMALLVTYLFTRLFNRFSQEKVFYIMIGSFLSFFAVFALILYPLREAIHPHALCNQLEAIAPKLQALIAMFRNWSFTLFYVMSELWGTAIMSVLFWAFANEIMTVKDAKRFYGILGVGANASAIFAGQIAILVSGQLFDLSFFFGEDAWGQSLGLVTTIVIFTGLLSIGIFRWYNTRVVDRDPAMKEKHVKKQSERKKVKMGMRKSFSYLAKSKYLLCIAALVIGFNLAINMIEIIWKDQISFLYPNPNDFNAYMGSVLKWIGFLSTFIAIFISGNMIRKMGWTFSALITPIALLVTGIFFFGIMLFKENPALIKWSAVLGFTPLALGVFFGTVQNVFSRACKYTLFDATKEISFIPLSSESKFKGKAAIDGVGSRLGKTGGSIIHGSLLMVFGTVSLSTPFVGAFLLLVVLGWIVAAQSLGRQFIRLTKQDEKIDIEEEEPTPIEDTATQKVSTI
ncbi:Npt1/Npt2 family nucleotide transporter [Candidatus Neptunichlamydia sp. REUL1]|uniref:Npt1/Npt2 family nucleotide transporter n=1 Tax=Candidatus Neptunichlamydia sp. REUL1 TaxID=3064277 RepID=UPI002931A9B6|nr:Npt1/Npt2 family nucleotide transporter [Candidatus Neptunochlamydia sp. REUL1]